MIRHIESLILLSVIASTGAAQSSRASTVADVPMDQLAVIAPRVAALRAVPATLTMRVGQTIQLDSIRVIAVDAKGHDIGRLRGYNFGIKPGDAATVVPRQVTGVRAGSSDLRVSFPTGPWGKRVQERPFTIVKVVVKP